MNLKPTPLTEASAVLAIAIALVFVTFSVTGGGVQSGLTMLTNVAMTFLLPSFTFWASIGLFIRKKSTAFRLMTSIVISLVVNSVLGNLFISRISDSTIGTELARQSAKALIAGMGIVTFIASAVGALITYLWLIRPRQSKP